jgi:hypothetical protein
MTHRSQNLLVSGHQEYFNEKRPVNVRVDGTGHFAEIFPRPGKILRETGQQNYSWRQTKRACATEACLAPWGAGSLLLSTPNQALAADAT